MTPDAACNGDISNRAIGDKDIGDELERVVASAAFRSAPRLAAFLRFVVEMALAGQSNRIKGYTIGVEALGRGESFDPQTDPIVRVEAGRLRRALARHYAGAGSNDPVVIELPRGGYVPTFRRRDGLAAGFPRVALREHDPGLLAAALPHVIELCRIVGLNRGHANWMVNGDGALDVVRTLNDLMSGLGAVRDLKEALEVVLDAAIRLHAADFGNVQLIDPRTGELRIYAQRGFKKPFLAAFARVSATDPCCCGLAMREGQPVIIEDVEQDSGFAPFRGVAAQAGFRAVQSTPLISIASRFVGVLSTHFVHPHRPSTLVMLVTKLYACVAADLLERLVPSDESLPAAPPGRLPLLGHTGT